MSVGVRTVQLSIVVLINYRRGSRSSENEEFGYFMSGSFGEKICKLCLERFTTHMHLLFR